MSHEWGYSAPYHDAAEAAWEHDWGPRWQSNAHLCCWRSCLYNLNMLVWHKKRGWMREEVGREKYKKMTAPQLAPGWQTKDWFGNPDWDYSNGFKSSPIGHIREYSYAANHKTAALWLGRKLSMWLDTFGSLFCTGKTAKSTVEFFCPQFIVWKDKTNSQAYSLIIYIQWTGQILLHFVRTDCNEKLKGMTVNKATNKT